MGDITDWPAPIEDSFVKSGALWRFMEVILDLNGDPKATEWMKDLPPDIMAGWESVLNSMSELMSAHEVATRKL